MSFRKDELILPEESDDEEEEAEGEAVQKEKPLPGIEDAYELVEGIEERMLKISGVIKGMDKRMSYNLRLIGSIVMQGKDNQEITQQTTDDERERLVKLVKKQTINQRKKTIMPKIKKMSDFASNKLLLTSKEDRKNIEAVKRKL